MAEESRRESRGDFLGDRTRVTVLFGVRPDAVAVLEVDAEIFDRLAPQLVDDALRYRASGQFGRQAECAQQA